MSQPKAIPHPHDEGKWMSSFDTYGHGPGNGKSRNAIYKRFKKVNEPDFVKSAPKKQARSPTVSESPRFSENNDLTEQARSSTILDNVEENLSKPSETDSESEPDSVKWGSIEWDEPEVDAEVKTSTIPKPLSEMAQGQRMAFNQESQAQMIRVGFRALDRALTHYGRGVMNSKDWSVERSESDYDALEGATSAVLEHYGVQVPVSPLMVLGVTLTTAYAPPLNHIRKNADPNRKRGRFLKAFKRLIPKRFRKKEVRGEPDEPVLE